MAKINFYQGQEDLLKLMQNKDVESLKDEQIKEIQKRIMEFFNVKNIHFLFGSGTSCNAIPNMKGLFKEVYEVVDLLGGEIKDELDSIIERIENKENLEEILGILYSNRIYLDKFDKLKDELEICNVLIRSIHPSNPIYLYQVPVDKLRQ